MIKVQTSSGKKEYALRGVQTPAGKTGVVKASALTPSGSVTFWDASVAGGFTIEALPPSVQGAQASGSPVPVSTQSVKVTPTGQSGEVSYSWAKTAGAQDWTIARPKSDTTFFQAASVFPNQEQMADFTCTATDALGRTATVIVSASVNNYGDPRGYELQP